MDKTFRKHYTPPRVLQETRVLLERSFLAGSGILEPLNMAGVETSSQEVDHTDFSSDDFNFVWN